MSKEDYFKYIVGDEKPNPMRERIAVALAKGITNAKKRAERPANRFSARQRMISHITDREYEGA